MVSKLRAALARRKPNGSGANRRTLVQAVATLFAATALFALVGCDKIPTWSEIVNGKKKDAAPRPAAPVAKQAEAPKAAPAVPKPPEPPKKTSQETIAEWKTTPTNRRTDAMLAALASFPEARDQITVLELQLSPISDAGMAELPKFDKVERLNISNVNYSNEALANVAQMKSVTAIAMTKGAQKEKHTDKGMGYLKQMKQLTELYLDEANLTPAGIAELAQMTQLEKLSVGYIGSFSDDNLQALSGLVNLKYLDISGSYVSDDGLKYLEPFTELEELKMAKMQAVRGRGLRDLVKNKGLRKLQVLTVYDNPYLQIEAYQGISNIKSLVALDVGAANCTNFAFENAMPPLKNLESLSVHQNDALSDPAMVQAFPKLKKLKSVYFENNHLISDASIPAFAKVKTLEAITLLHTAVTPSGAARLKAKLKNCRINYNGKML